MPNITQPVIDRALKEDSLKYWREFRNAGIEFDIEWLENFFEKHPNGMHMLRKYAKNNAINAKAIQEAIDKEGITRDVGLNLTEFNKLNYFTDTHAIARIIQNIIVTNPGTYPNNPDFGVGIEKYLFDFASKNTEANLRSEIKDQLNRWLVTNNNVVYNFELKYLKSDNNAYTHLVIIFNIYKEDITNQIEEHTFELLLTGDPDNKKIISKIKL